MDHSKSVELKVMSCVRAMGRRPAALVFIDGSLDWTFDLPSIYGIPVFHATALTCSRWGTSNNDCPFIPVGANDGEISYHDRVIFSMAWDRECCLK